MIIKFLVPFCLIAFFSPAQVKPKSSIKAVKSPKKELIENQHQDSESSYIISEYRLSSYFLNNKIPADFPKKVSSLSETENKKIALEWAKANKNLFKEKYQSEMDKLNF
jgi:hypothetical protein